MTRIIASSQAIVNVPDRIELGLLDDLNVSMD